MHLYTWDSYDDPAILAEFEAKTGIRVVVDRFASNEELLAKLMGGAKGYDVIVPSDYMVSVMVRQGLLAELDKRALPNLSGMDPRFMGRYFDPENRWSVPYLWGVSGIGYDSERVDPAPKSWGVFWDERYSGRMSLMNDHREVFAMALQRLGLPVGTREEVALERAKKSLMEQRGLVKTYNSENVRQLLISGETLVSHVWSGEVNQAAAEKPSLKFSIPKEGGFIYQDNLCIPKASVNQEAAKKLVDFLLEPKNIARISAKVGYGCPSRAGWEFLPEALRKNPTIVPQDAVLKKLQWIPDIGDAAALYDRLWTELKSN